MTRKQLQNLIFFISCYDSDMSELEVERHFGIKDVSLLGREEALTWYLDFHKKKLSEDKNTTVRKELAEFVQKNVKEKVYNCSDGCEYDVLEIEEGIEIFQEKLSGFVEELIKRNVVK